MCNATRYLSTLLAMLLIAGCSGDSTTDATLAATTTTDRATTTTAEATTAPLQDSGSFEVTTTVVSHETTQDMWVFAPDGEGPWPVVFAYHGQGGTGDGLSTTAENLASSGKLVFAPTYRSTEPQHIEQDLECSYRYAMSIAEDYGGDLNYPITYFGHSFGGQMGLLGGLSEATYGPGGTYDECFTGVQRPDVIVAVTACYYENPDGDKYPFNTTGYSNLDAKLVIIGGVDDDTCELWQSQDATEALQATGYDTTLVEIDGGNHANVVFYEVVNGEWLVRPDEPVGHEVVQLTIDAIDSAG